MTVEPRAGTLSPGGTDREDSADDAGPRPEGCLSGGGQMGARVRAADWSATPLGPVSAWPQSLRTALSMMLDAGVAMIVAWGPELRCFYNDRYAPILGTKHPQALGAPCSEIFSEIWHSIGPELEGVRRGGTFAIDDWLLPLERSGHRENCWFSISFSPIRDESGGVGGLLAVVAETTGRVEGERRLATLREQSLAELARVRRRAEATTDELQRAIALVEATLANVPVGLVIFNHELRFIQINDTLARWNGWDSRQVVGRTLEEVAPPASYGWLAPRILEVIATGRASEPAEQSVPGLARPAELRHWLITCYPVYRGLVGVVAVDVTDEIRARDRLARTIEYNDKFTAILGHDLRNPLNAIMTTAQLLQRRAKTDEIARPATRIVASGERMLRMINQLYDLARVRVTGGLRLQPRSVDLAELCRNVVDELRAAYPGADLELVTAGDLVGEWDGDRVAQVLSNLIGNALEHGARAPVRVRLDGREPGRAVIRVENQGAIPEAILPLLFDPYRGAEHRNAKARGLGLGLYISHEIVIAHGGTLTVRSSAEAGTCFEVELPRPEAQAGEPGAPVR